MENQIIGKSMENLEKMCGIQFFFLVFNLTMEASREKQGKARLKSEAGLHSLC